MGANPAGEAGRANSFSPSPSANLVSVERGAPTFTQGGPLGNLVLRSLFLPGDRYNPPPYATRRTLSEHVLE